MKQTENIKSSVLDLVRLPLNSSVGSSVHNDSVRVLISFPFYEAFDVQLTHSLWNSLLNSVNSLNEKNKS